MFVYIWLTNLAEMKGPGDGYNATTDHRPIESALGVVRMRKDGFVALASPTYGEEALVTTVPIVAGGEMPQYRCRLGCILLKTGAIVFR